MEEETLDLRGLKCPLPAMLGRKALARLPPGGSVTILASDPLAVVDIPHMCSEEGHIVERVIRRTNQDAFHIVRGA